MKKYLFLGWNLYWGKNCWDLFYIDNNKDNRGKGKGIDKGGKEEES